MIGLILALAATLPAPLPGEAPAAIQTARCVVVSDPRGAQALLATVPGSRREAGALSRLEPLMRGCGNARGGGAVRLDLRAAVALVLVEQRLARGTPDPAMLSRGEDWFVQAAARDGGDPARLGSQRFGGCVVRAAPAAATRFLQAEPGSAAEGAALQQLAPAIGPCTPAGDPVRFTRMNLRRLLAEPFYHAALTH
jgi:hypothetical protein